MGWGEIAAAIGQAAHQTANQLGWFGWSHEQSYTKLLQRRAKELQQWQALEMPTLEREGLEKAGYNPLLAIGGLSGAVGGTVPGGGGSPGGNGDNPVKSYLDAKQLAANIDLTKANTDRVRAEVGVDAWRPVHVSRAEASHYGVKLLNKLGINLSTNKSASFTLFYNPITKELRNPFTGDGASTEHANTAEDVSSLSTIKSAVENTDVPINLDSNEVRQKKQLLDRRGINVYHGWH